MADDTRDALPLVIIVGKGATSPAALSDVRRLLARLGLGETSLAAGSPDEALVYFEPLSSSSDPRTRGLALQGRGIAALVKGDTDAALAHLRAAVSADETAWRAWNGLARVYDHQRQWAQADAAYDNALRHSPSAHVVLNNWGMSLLARDRTAEAADKFAQALRREPTFDVATTNLRFALAMQGKYREALGGVDDSDLPGTLNNVGYAALLRGDRDNAERYLAQAMEGAPTFNETAWKNLKWIKDNDQQR